MYWNLNSSRPERANFLLVLNCMTTKLIFQKLFQMVVVSMGFFAGHYLLNYLGLNMQK